MFSSKDGKKSSDTILPFIYYKPKKDSTKLKTIAFMKKSSFTITNFAMRCFLLMAVSTIIWNTSIFAIPPGHKKIYVTKYDMDAAVINGRVVDENGNPLSSATIQVKGSDKFTVSDNSGNFSIDANPGDILLISYNGYQKKEVAVKNNTSLEVAMELAISKLDEVVVIGYGTQKRSDVIGAISSVKGEDIKDLPVNGINEALQGRVAGVQVNNDGGAPGQGASIIIRGPVNIRGTGPLYVVDGVPFSGTGNNFNLQDIESIEVVKDAGAAAIYGSRAAGGVILVTTKKGKSGRLKVAVNANYGVKNIINLPQFLNKSDYIKARVANGDDAIQFFGPESGRAALTNTDWNKVLWRQGTDQNYSVALSGGSEQSTFFMSTNYNQQNGTRIDNDFRRYSFRLNTEHKLNSKLKVGQTLYLSSTKENPTNASNQGIVNYRSSPVMLARDPSNPIGGWGKVPTYFQGGNQLADELSTYARNKSNEINLNIYGNWEIIDGLTFHPSAAIKYSEGDNYYYDYPYDVGNAQRTVADFGKGIGYSIDYLANGTLNYHKTFGRHDFNILGGYEAIKTTFTNLDGSIDQPYGVLTQNFGLVRSNVNRNVNGNAGDYYRVLSQFGRLIYSYNDKYSLLANIRRDGVSTKFGPNNRYGVFPSVEVGWKIKKEIFMTNVTFLSDLKLRGSYGLLGNSDIPDFQFLRSYSTGYVADLGGGRSNSISLTTQIPNENIQWENVTTTDVGFDAGALNNKLTVSFDYYSRQTKKMLYDIPIPGSAGQGSSIPFNIGRMSNKGVEVTVDYRSNAGKFTYHVGFNGAFNKNKLISLDPSIKGEFFDGGTNEIYNATASKSAPGYSLGQFFGLVSTGIYQTDADGAKGPIVKGDKDYTPKAGDLIYKDLNSDGVIDDKDRDYIGNPWPKLVYGFNLGGGWKGFDIRLYFTGALGIDIYNANESFDNVLFSDYNTTSKIFGTSFFNGNGLTDKPRSYYPKTDPDFGGTDPNHNWTKISSYHVQKGDYFRLRNAQIGYALGETILQKVSLSAARIFLMADNLFTITKYKGIDPDLGGGVRSRGIDQSNGRYPISRLFSIGLNINFK